MQLRQFADDKHISRFKTSDALTLSCAGDHTDKTINLHVI